MQFLLSMPGGAEWLLILLALAGGIFWIGTIITVVRTKFPDETTKIVWLLVVILVGFIGAILFHLFGKPKTAAEY